MEKQNEKRKIVINVCFGGFGLSDEAFELYMKKKNIKWVEKDANAILDRSSYYSIPKKEYSRLAKEAFEKDGSYKNFKEDECYLSYSNIERDDPILVEVVEELGEKVNSRCAKLEVVEIPADVKWAIDEYDGNESIHEVHRSWR